MAGVEGKSGGYRPTAPQNNTGVSATGGAGSKNGQPNRYISGGKYGEGKALMAQQQGAPMAKGPVTQKGEMGGFSAAEPSTPFVRRGEMGGTLLDDKTGPIGPITAGVDFGRGPGSDALPKNISAETRPGDNQAIIKKYFPALLRASQLKDTPDSYKRFISYLSGQISG
jgi:hypothetical protein